MCRVFRFELVIITAATVCVVDSAADLALGTAWGAISTAALAKIVIHVDAVVVVGAVSRCVRWGR